MPERYLPRIDNPDQVEKPSLDDVESRGQTPLLNRMTKKAFLSNGVKEETKLREITPEVTVPV